MPQEEADLLRVRNDTITHFLKEYLDRGYARMKPAHIEYYLFFKLKKFGFFDENKQFSETKAANLLRTDLATIRRVRAKSDVLYESDVKLDLKFELKSLLANSALSIKQDQIRLRVTNITLRGHLEEYLSTHGTIVDFSFNKHLLTMQLVQFVNFLNTIFGKEVQKEFLEQIAQDKKIVDALAKSEANPKITVAKVGNLLLKSSEFASNIVKILETLQVIS